MQLLLVGYGKMNRLVEQLAHEQGIEVAGIIRSSSDWPQSLPADTVAIDFSVPSAVVNNVGRALQLKLPIVIGTTGWYEQLDRVRELVARAGGALIYAANFSIGVNAFYRIVEAAAQALPRNYDAFISETHHRQKKDAPSGTAVRLNQLLQRHGWTEAPVTSTRAGAIPGIHTVGFDSEADTITLTHTARSRRGFAEGALWAARWIAGRKGLYDFSEVFESAAQLPGDAHGQQS